MKIKKINKKRIAALGLATIMFMGFTGEIKAEDLNQTEIVETVNESIITKEDMLKLYDDYKSKYEKSIHIEIDEQKLITFVWYYTGEIVFTISYFDENGNVYHQDMIQHFNTKDETQACYDSLHEYSEYYNIVLLSDNDVSLSITKEYLEEIQENAFARWQEFIDMSYEFRGLMVDNRPKKEEIIEPTMPLIGENQNIKANIITDYCLRFDDSNGNVLLKYDENYRICSFETLVHCSSLKEAEQLVHDAIRFGGEQYYYTTEAYIEENSFCVHLVRNELKHLVENDTMYEYITYIIENNPNSTYYDMRSQSEQNKYPLNKFKNVIQAEQPITYDYNSNTLINEENSITTYANGTKTSYVFKNNELSGIYTITSYNSNPEALQALEESKQNPNIGFTFLFGKVTYDEDLRTQLYCQYTYDYCLKMTNNITNKDDLLNTLKNNNYTIINNTAKNLVKTK